MKLNTSTELMATSVVTQKARARTPNYCAQHEVEHSQQIAIDFLPTTLLHLETRSSYHKTLRISPVLQVTTIYSFSKENSAFMSI